MPEFCGTGVSGHYPQCFTATNANLIIEDFGSQVFCYHCKTGETHYLTRFPAEILFLLIKQPMTSKETAKQLAQRFQAPLNSNWYSQVVKALNSLQQQALIDPIDGIPCA